LPGEERLEPGARGGEFLGGEQAGVEWLHDEMVLLVAEVGWRFSARRMEIARGT
jgi:hypothetical protein